MSLEGKSKNVAKWVLFSPFKGTAPIYKIWEDLVVYGQEILVPHDDDEDEITRDKLFYDNIREDEKNKRTDLYEINTRGELQDRIIDENYPVAVKRIRANGFWKNFIEACGGIGKSFLDPVISAFVELALTKRRIRKLTGNYKGYASVNFYHSTVTLPKNGRDCLRWRRGAGILTDEGFVMSGTTVAQEEDDAKITFKKTTNPDTMALWILDALENGRTPQILALMHHANIVMKVEKKLKKLNPKFKWFRINKDEIDLYWNPQTNYGKAHELDAVWHTGSTATLVESSNTDLYTTNNIAKLGIRTSHVTMTETENEELVKPTNIAEVRIPASEVLAIFPDVKVGKDNLIDWNQTVKFDGVNPENALSQTPQYPTLSTILTNMAVLRVLPEYPNNRQCIRFANRLVTNKLAEQNWTQLADKIYGKNPTKLQKEVRNMYMQTFNDDTTITSKMISSFKQVLSYAKTHPAWSLGSSKIAGRGFDDSISPKLNTAWWYDTKDIRTMVQEWMRIIRLDGARPNDEALLIVPIFYNDLDTDITKHHTEKESATLFRDILKFNQSIADEAIEYAKAGTTKSRKPRIKLYGFQTNLTELELDNFKNFLSSEIYWNNRYDFGTHHSDVAKASNDWLKYRMEQTNPSNKEEIAISLQKTLADNPWIEKNYTDPKDYLKFGHVSKLSQDTQDIIFENKLMWIRVKQSYKNKHYGDISKAGRQFIKNQSSYYPLGSRTGASELNKCTTWTRTARAELSYLNDKQFNYARKKAASGISILNGGYYGNEMTPHFQANIDKIKSFILQELLVDDPDWARMEELGSKISAELPKMDIIQWCAENLGITRRFLQNNKHDYWTDAEWEIVITNKKRIEKIGSIAKLKETVANRSQEKSQLVREAISKSRKGQPSNTMKAVVCKGIHFAGICEAVKHPDVAETGHTIRAKCRNSEIKDYYYV